MPLPILRVFVFLIATVALMRPVQADIAPEDVRDAIKRGVRFLTSRQMKDRGNWPPRAGFPGGLTALCTLALLESGEPVDSPAVQKALSYLRSLGGTKTTYSSAMQIMVYAAAEPKKDMLLIEEHARWLELAQIRSGPRAGAWTYFAQTGPNTRGDNSNSQIALLGLNAAERVGVAVEPTTWQLAQEYWLSCQRPDGAWTYYKPTEGQPESEATGGRTCAGISSLVISSGRLSDGDARVVGGRVQCCQSHDDFDALERAFEWLGSRFSVNINPGPRGLGGLDLSRSGLFYYLYGVERIGRLTGRRYIGRHDWYREGAEMLVQQQDKLTGFWKGVGHGEDDPLIATSFALLFLAKGRRPVVMAKLQHGYGDDWDSHRSGVHNLTRYVESRWRQKLSWQTIAANAATLEDLLETPVLFISGREALDLTAEQKQNLKDYVNQDGFIFAEACCDGTDFDQSFRQLMKELFPDSALRLLPAEHAIWFAEQQVAANQLRPLYGIDACCRTSVVYCPKDLSCLWELSRDGRDAGYPQAVQDEIDACNAIGANVLAYATNRILKDKLDRPRVNVREASELPTRGTLAIPKLTHGGGSNDATNSLPNLLRVIRTETDLPISTDQELLAPDDSRILDHPISFIHGRRDFRFSERERRALATYLRRGGFLFGDAICASEQFAAAFRRELKAAIPEAQFVRIAENHPIFSQDLRGYDLSQVTLRDPQMRTDGDPLKSKLIRIKPFLEGVEIDGRLAVVFSPYDISCAMENHASLECKGYVKADAARIGANIVLFALQQ